MEKARGDFTFLVGSPAASDVEASLRSFIQAPFISYVTKLGHGRLGNKVERQLITLLFHARRDLYPPLPIRRLRASLLILGQWRGGIGRRPDIDGMSERRVADAPEQRLSSNASI